MEVKVIKEIPDGQHNNCEITRVDERTEPYHYIDFYVKVEGVEIKDGCPGSISIDDDGQPQSKLAKRLTAFGMKIPDGKDVTIEEINKHFTGLKATVMTENEDVKGKGKFARVLSMKPAK